MKAGVGNYYMGLDIGTDSVGWAVTDEDYHILQFKNKAMWGIHLFEKGKTADERRLHRGARHRLDRRRQRIKLLRELFAPEISKVDIGFFERLDESRRHMVDRKADQPNSLFNDADFNDKDFHKKYPTIYHLRLHLMNTKEKPDIRLVYLAIHHIIKYRGHFLFKGITDEDIPGFEVLFTELFQSVNEELGFDLCADNIMQEIEETIANAELGVRDKGRKLQDILGAEELGEKEILALIAGIKVDMDKLFGEEIGIKFSFKDANYEESREEYEDMLGPDRARIIGLCRSIYDRSVLSRVLDNHDTLSEAKVADYEQHKRDLKLLKWAIKTYVPEIFDEVFKSERTENNYCAYSKQYGKRVPEKKSCTQEMFCDYIRKKILKEIPSATVSAEPLLKNMMKRLANSTFMPKQTIKDNSIVPYTVHRKELIRIMSNVAPYYPFLNETDSEGISVIDKILKINEFRVPYYVGPLNPRSERSWVVRSNEKITPWNFERVVDLDASAVGFIENLTNMCSYLHGEKVLPKESLLYSEFRLYDELNNIQINKERIDPKLKQDMVRDLFENVNSVKKVKLKDIQNYLKIKGLIKDEDEITGIDRNIKSNLRSFVSIRKVIPDKMSDRTMVEDIIRTITLFGDERSRVYKKLKNDHEDKLTDEEIKGLSRLQFKDWGNLSRKLLTGLYQRDNVTGISTNIMTYMEQTQDNFMQILNKYDFKTKIDEENKKLEHDGKTKLHYSMVDELQISPAVKRGVWRALDIVQDVLKIMKRPPSKIFVETTRERGERGKRTESRKAKLERLYRECKRDVLEDEEERKRFLENIEEEDEGRLKGRSLFLYYMQHGKCMYCCKPLNISELGNNEAMDRDHLYPQSKIKDDSIHNNMVLVCRECNQKKGDSFPLSPEIQNQQNAWWGHLKDGGFITSEKYARLVRKTELTEEELTRFINRQIVETGQSVKGVITVLNRLFKDSDIIYVKGRNVSEFRHDNGFVKCRIVNDYHHAKDAYLNIVVGNAYDTKFTKDPKSFVEKSESYNLKKMYDIDISRNGKTAWRSGESGTISTVRTYIGRNNIQFTRFPTESKGALFDQNPLKKRKDGKLLRPKEGLDSEKYGGYDNVRGAYFTLVEYDGPKERQIAIRPVMIHSSKEIEKDPQNLKKLMESEGLKNPRIVIKKIKVDSLLEIGGFPCFISGRSNNRLLLKGGVQLLLPDDLYAYCKKIAKYMEDRANRESYPVGSYGFDTGNNLKLYDHLLDKAKGERYGPMLKDTLAKNLEGLRGNFISSEMDVQVRTLNMILRSFRCNADVTDLKEIGGGKTGILSQNMNLSGSSNKMWLVFRSPSGLFERRESL